MGGPYALTSLPAGRNERLLALGVVLVSAALFVVAAPFAKRPLGQVWAFVPIYESALVISDLITAVLLFGQFSAVRARAALVLAGGYLFTAFTTISLCSLGGALAAAAGLTGLATAASTCSRQS